MMELGKGGQSERPRLNNGKRQQSSSPSESEAVAAAAARFKFMSVVSDHVLQEILVRLPDSRSVIQCLLVCKRWFSLVSRRSQSRLYFIRKFNHHHRLKRLQQQQQQQLPYTLLIKGLRPDIYWPGSPSYHLQSDKHKILDQGNVFTYTDIDGEVEDEKIYLDFLPWPSDRGCIISSFDDLLLMRVGDYLQFCICNPQTKQWILLPDIPFHLPSNYNFSRCRCGFVCKPNCNCNSQFQRFGGGMSSSSASSSSSSSSCYCNCSIKYRVALFMTSNSNSQVFSVAVFSSETGQWRKSKLRFPDNLRLRHETSIGNNGIIYCSVGDTMLKGIVAFDPFKDDSEEEEEEQQQQRCRLISLPSEFSQGWVDVDSAKAHLGVVRGRLRLVQFYFIRTSNTYALKAWELDDGDHNNASWDMVHNVRFRRSDKSVLLAPVALHPEDGDVVFLRSYPNGGVIFNDIFQYTIESGDDVEHVFRCRSASCFFPLVHPWWPTTIPSLPSSS